MLLAFKGQRQNLHPSVYVAPGAKIIGAVTRSKDDNAYEARCTELC